MYAVLLFSLLPKVRSVHLLSLLLLPGTVAHELCHWFAAAISNGKPSEITFVPKSKDNSDRVVLGEVRFVPKWYNGAFIALAPLWLIPLVFGLTADLMEQVSVPAGILLAYANGSMLYASIPSWTDWNLAVKNFIGIPIVLFTLWAICVTIFESYQLI